MIKKERCEKCGNKSKLMCLNCNNLLVDIKEIVKVNESNTIQEFFFLNKIYIRDLQKNISSGEKLLKFVNSPNPLFYTRFSIDKDELLINRDLLSKGELEFLNSLEKKSSTNESKIFPISNLWSIIDMNTLSFTPKQENEYLESLKKVKRTEIYWYRMGEYYLIKEEWNKAIEAFEKSYKRNPFFINTLFHIGFIYFQLKDYEGALDIFNECLKHRYTTDLYSKKLSLICMSRTYEAKEEYKESIKIYQKLLKKTIKKSKKKEFWLKIASLYFYLKEFDEVKKSLHKSLSLDLGFTNAWNLLFKVYEYMVDHNELIQFCMDTVLSNYNNAYHWNNLGKSLLFSNDHYDLALEIFKNLFEIYPNDDEICHNIVLANIKMQNYEQAIALCKEIKKYKEHDELILSYLGIVYLKLNQEVKAMEYLKRSLELDSEHPVTLYYLSLLYNDLKKHDLALEYCKKSLEIDPFTKEVRDFYEMLSNK